jgi:uncharacterized protein
LNQTFLANAYINMNKTEEIRHIIEHHKVIAVVGLSANPMRPSHGVAQYMQRQGYKIIPVNPMETEVLGEKCFAKLSDIPEKVDLVNIFRRSEEAGKIVDEAIEIGAKSVWLQEGVIDEEAAKRAEDIGLIVVMDKCWLKECYRFNSKK